MAKLETIILERLGALEKLLLDPSLNTEVPLWTLQRIAKKIGDLKRSRFDKTAVETMALGALRAAGDNPGVRSDDDPILVSLLNILSLVRGQEKGS